MQRKMAMISRQINLKDVDQEAYDLEYWMSKTPQERLQSVTHLIRQNMVAGQKMDRGFHQQRLMK
jgi:hypothetical protein